MSYRSRLKEAFSLRRPELYVRVGVGTALATAAFNLFMPEANSPIRLQQEPSLDQETSIQQPEGVTYLPAEMAPVIERGPSVRIDVPQAYASDFNASPLTDVATQQVAEYAAELRAITQNDPSAYVTVRLAGSASDESRIDSFQGDANLGVPSEQNATLAHQRAQLAGAALRATTTGDLRISIDEVTGVEAVLAPEEVAMVDHIALTVGLTRQELLAQYNSANLALSENDRHTMQQLFDVRRGAQIEATVLRDVTPVLGTCDEVVREVVGPSRTARRTQPDDDGWQIDIIPMVVPPLPYRRRHAENEADKRIVGGIGGAATGGVVAGPAPRGRHRPEYIRRQQRGVEAEASPARRRNRYVGRALGVAAAAAALFPWPSWRDQPADVLPAASQDCLETVTEPGWRRDVVVSFPVVHVVDQLTGDHLGPTDIHLFTDVQPTKTTYTYQEYTRYKVDENGVIVSQEDVPEKSRVAYRTPRFTK